MSYKVDELCVNALRFLSIDQINNAKSGHPGICLGAAPIIHTLFTRHLTVDPEDPTWFNRDRFILSASHGAALLYSALHFSGFDISLDDLKAYCKYKSKTPNYPEFLKTPGVEATTAFAGEGIAVGVGMALGEKFLEGKFNKRDNQIINHYTYILCGDGCLQEGRSMEAMSLAGKLELDKLIILYDSNDVSQDGEISLTCNDDIKMKVEAMNFAYFKVEDGNDITDIDIAITAAKKAHKPALIEIKTSIGYGSPNAGDSSVHSGPLGDDNTKELKGFLEWPYDEFVVPTEVYQFYNSKVIMNGNHRNTIWNKRLSDYQDEYPSDYEVLDKLINDDYDLNLDYMPSFSVGIVEATKATCARSLAEISSQIPTVIGGCADSMSETNARGANGNYDLENNTGRNICFGLREEAMGHIVNGLTLYGLRGFCGTYLVNSFMEKRAIRLAAMMKLASLFIFSHDSITVGEDGPSYQPIEELAMLRSIPNCNVMVPCDPNETVYAFALSQKRRNGPTVIVTTKQKVRTLDGTSYDKFIKGGYIIYPEKGPLDGVIISAGATVSLAIDVAVALEKEKLYLRVVSMPSMYLFDKMDKEYQKAVIPNDKKVMALELAHPMPWFKYTKNVYGITNFGATANANTLLTEYGFTIPDIIDFYKSL